MADPRWLDADAAAAYICVRVDRLGRLVADGKIPAPSYHLGPRQPRWDRQALDAQFDPAAGSDDVLKAEQDAVQAIRDRARENRQKNAGGRVSPRISLRRQTTGAPGRA